MRFWSFAIIVFFISHSNAQTLELVDKENQEPISRVHFNVFSLGGELLSNGYSDDRGRVSLEDLTDNLIVIHTRHISYMNYADTIDLVQDSLRVELSPYYFSLNEVLVTAQIDPTTRTESVNNVLQISRKQIEESSALNLGEILGQKALFDVQIDPAIGTSISVQGLQGNNMNILIDGIPVIGRKGSQIDISQLNLSNIEKIEILKGPASVSYGSNSTGGVINLITKSNFDKDQVDLTTYYESIGVHQINLDVQKKYKKHYFNLNIGNYDFKGFSSDSLRHKEWKPKIQYFGELKWSAKFKNTQLGLKSYYFEEEIIDFGNENYPPFDGSAIDNYFLTYRNLNDFSLYSKRESYSIKGVISHANTRFNKAQYLVELPSNQKIQTDSPDYNAEDLFEAIYSRWEYNRFNFKNWKVQIGADIRHESVTGSKIKTGEAQTFECSYFSKAEIKLSNKWKAQLGVRLPYHSIYAAPLSPSIHIQHSRNSDTQWRVSYARGYRAPSIKELFMEFIDFNHNIVGNTNLRAEYSHAFNSSISMVPLKRSNAYLKFDLESSFQYLRNKINLAQVENSMAYMYYNLSKARYFGVYASLDAKVSSNSNFLLSWNRFETKADELDQPITGEYIGVKYSYNSQKYNLGANLDLKIKPKNTFQRIQDDIMVDVQQEAYQLLNISFFKTFTNLNSNLSIGVKNLMDVNSITALGEQTAHSGSESIISWGRTFFVKFKILFQ
jgi:outer membrane receptor for ferrienterochelin and colicins